MKVVVKKVLKVRWSSQSDNIVVVTQKGSNSKFATPSVHITCFSPDEIKSMRKK